MGISKTQRAYVIFAWITLGTVIVQFFLAGLGVFGGTFDFHFHRIFPIVIAVSMITTLALASVARLPGRVLALAALQIALLIVQGLLIDLWHGGLVVAGALHPVNGLAIFALAAFAAARARQVVAVRAAVAAAARLTAVRAPERVSA
ncbi:MAG TPA: DUF6220 domain-containing protein [Ktedonobacterales bacterium]|nr:DUF6220 domain-containing protein [Ktedonobacterales bacterium]